MSSAVLSGERYFTVCLRYTRSFCPPRLKYWPGDTSLAFHMNASQAEVPRHCHSLLSARALEDRRRPRRSSWGSPRNSLAKGADFTWCKRDGQNIYPACFPPATPKGPERTLAAISIVQTQCTANETNTRHEGDSKLHAATSSSSSCRLTTPSVSHHINPNIPAGCTCPGGTFRETGASSLGWKRKNSTGRYYYLMYLSPCTP